MNVNCKNSRNKWSCIFNKFRSIHHMIYHVTRKVRSFVRNIRLGLKSRLNTIWWAVTNSQFEIRPKFKIRIFSFFPVLTSLARIKVQFGIIVSPSRLLITVDSFMTIWCFQSTVITSNGRLRYITEILHKVCSILHSLWQIIIVNKLIS